MRFFTTLRFVQNDADSGYLQQSDERRDTKMPRIKITSFQNPHLKEVHHLRESKTRRSTGLTLVEGLREVSAAKQAGVPFKKLFVCPEILKRDKHEWIVEEFEFEKIPIVELSKEIFAKISFGDRMEGILGICRPRVLRLEDFSSRKNSLWVAVEDVEKPGNLGAILRTCDGAGVDGILVCDAATDLYNPNAIRASLGTIFSVPAAQTTNEAALKFFKDRKIKVCVTTPRAEKFYSQVDFNVPVAIILGSEEKGLSDFWLKNADVQVNIPMRGAADSLNVSVSAGIIIYEAVRQRNKIRG